MAAIDSVDYVAINNTPTAVNLIKIFKPNFYCKGKDYKDFKKDITGEIKNELKELKKFKGKLIITEELTFSSSRLINKSTNFFSTRQKKTLKKISKKFDFNSIKKNIDNFNKLKILVIGETIIDQYNFCEAVGKSGKEPMLVLKEIKNDQYLGGVLSIAKNLAQFSKKISVISILGEKKEFLREINSNLNNNIKTKFLFKKNSPTIVKKRYVDNLSKNKIIGMYKINDEILSKNDELVLNNILLKDLNKYDLVIVSDYGHGMISKKSAEIICKKSKFLAINAQVNASNIGFHTIRNYKNFNTLIINEKEIRHEMRDKISKTEILMNKLSKQKNIKNIIVTMGASGSVLYCKKEKKFYYADAYAHKTVDKVGAGDTMLSLIGPSIGSLGAAQSVETIGNKETVNKLKILKTLESILK